MKQLRLLMFAGFLSLVLVEVPEAFAMDPARCMDCTEQVTYRIVGGVTVWQIDAMCCHHPCWPSSYQVEEENVGFGCLTCEIKADEMPNTTGRQCCSNKWDENCEGTRDPGDTGGNCTRDSSGACPSWCTTCS